MKNKYRGKDIVGEIAMLEESIRQQKETLYKELEKCRMLCKHSDSKIIDQTYYNGDYHGDDSSTRYDYECPDCLMTWYETTYHD